MEIQDRNTLNDFWEHSASKFSHKTAIALSSFRLTYNQLDQHSTSVAVYLQKKGIKQGDHVALLSENSPVWGILFWGIIKAGAVLVSLDVFSTHEELCHVLTNSETNLCLASDTQIHKLREISKDISSLSFSAYSKAIANQSITSYTPVVVQGNDTAIIIYTSGTMGNQKGVMLSHSNIVSNVQAVFKIIPYSPGTSVVSLIPLSHMYGINAGFLSPLYNGGSITYSKSHLGSDILEALTQSKAEIVIVVPLILKKFYESIFSKVETSIFFPRLIFKLMCLLASLLKGTGVSAEKQIFKKIHQKFGGNIKFFVSGGAPLEPHIDSFFNTIGLPVLNGYGLTETSPTVCVNSLERRKSGSAGKVITGMQVKLSEKDEILVKGTSVMQGYYKDESATKKVLQNGWFQTGDTGEFDKHGYLYIKERIKNVIVLPSGLKLFPSEIESIICKSKYINEVCIIGEKIGNEEKPMAVIYPNYDLLNAIPSDNRNHIIRQELELYQKQSSLHTRVLNFTLWKHELPKTSTKKIRRKAIESEINSLTLCNKPEKAVTLANEETEASLATVIRQFIHNRTVEITEETDLYNDLGIDSIMKLELISAIENHLSISIPHDIAYRLEKISDVTIAIKIHAGTNKQTSETPEKQKTTSKRSQYIKQICSFFINGLLRAFYKVELINGERIPKTGTFIFVANHTSMLDFPILYNTVPKEIRKHTSVPAAYDYFYKRSISTYLFRTMFNMFPMKRYSNYYDGLKICADKLQNGKSLIIFPEGTRSISGKLQRFKPGIGLLACKQNIPIIPIYIQGTFRALPKGAIIPRPGTIKIFVGKAIDASGIKQKCKGELNYVLFQKITEEAQRAIEELSISQEPRSKIARHVFENSGN